VAFAPDGKLLAAVLDPALDHSGGAAEVILWGAGEGKPAQALPGSEGVEVIAFSRDGKTLLGAARTKLLVWDVATGKAIQESELRPALPEKARAILAFSPDGKALAVSDQRVIALYDLKTAKRTRTLGGEGGIESLCFSQDGNTLAGGCSDGTIYLWDFDRGGGRKK